MVRKAPSSVNTAVDPRAPTAVGGAVTVERIAHDLASAIVDKRIPPGTWLREEALGRVYSVSRTKVRAALVMLAKDKLVENIPDKGTFVCKPGLEEAREVFSMRRLLEAEVVRLFVAKASAADFERLREQIQIERSALHAHTHSGVHERLLGGFHVVLAECTGHKVLTELVSELVARSALIAMLYQSSNDPHCSTEEHEQFLRICEAGQVEAAVRNMHEHLLRLEASLDLTDAPPERPLDLVNALMM